MAKRLQIIDPNTFNTYEFQGKKGLKILLGEPSPKARRLLPMYGISESPSDLCIHLKNKTGSAVIIFYNGKDWALQTLVDNPVSISKGVPGRDGKGYYLGEGHPGLLEQGSGYAIRFKEGHSVLLEVKKSLESRVKVKE